jgi:translation initiation factor IF-3
MKILEDLAEEVSALAKVEAAPKLDGRNMVMVLAPDRRAKPPVRKDFSGTAADGAAAQDGAAGAAVPPLSARAPSVAPGVPELAVAVDGARAQTPASSGASVPGPAGKAPVTAGHGDEEAGLAAAVSANGVPVSGGVVGASS